MVWRTTLRHHCELRLAQQRLCLSFHWRTMTQEANWASSQHTPGKGRVTEIVRDVVQQKVVVGG